MKRTQQDNLDKASDELRELIREGRGMCNDLQRLIKEAREVISTDVANTIDAKVHEHLTLNLEKLGEATKLSIEQTEHSIYKRFENLTGLLMGENRYEPTIDEIIKVHAWQKQNGEKLKGGD